MVIIETKIQGHPMILDNIYVPNVDDLAFFAMLECKTGEAENAHN